MKTNTLETTVFSPYEVAQNNDLIIQRVGKITDDGLARVITPGKNFLASADRLFRHPFGRDSAIAVDKLQHFDSDVVRQAALLMVATQGVRQNPMSEEEPGKIFHEMKWRGSDPRQQAIFDELSARLGIGDGETFISYTSVDATLEFIHLVAHHIELHGRDFLSARVNRQGESVTVEQGFNDAVAWLRRTIARSDIGLIGAHRSSPNSVIVPDLLDGATSFLHADGKTLINYTKEVNTLNFQSLGYQAFKEAAGLAIDESEQIALLEEAERLRQKTLEHFWIPARDRVAMAVDRDPSGKLRQLETESVLPAVALRTGIFDENPEIVESIFKRLYTPEMMTCVGPRTQVLGPDAEYTRYQDPPWPVLVGRVVEGAMRYHEYAIAMDLIERMLAGAYAAGQAEEFHQVTVTNELGIYAANPTPDTITVAATNKPEAPQGWTAATYWKVLNVILPFLEERQASAWEWEQTPRIGNEIDLSLNKQLKTVSYELDQSAALEAEAELLAAAEAQYGGV